VRSAAVSHTELVAMATPLLTTKLLIPPPKNGQVFRPHLLAKLDEGAHRTLTLVCAPAGYGKTTLLSEWASRKAGSDDPAPMADASPHRFNYCWVTLDEPDNDEARFLSYLQASLEALHTGVGATAAAMGEAFPLPPLPTILTALMNDLHASAAPIVLILDDYQFISNPAIHEGMAFFLDRLPPNVHVMIATRSDPPLPLARLRGRGQLVEMRAEDLRFSLAEAQQMLTQVVGQELGAQEVTRLEQRTEGWAAGLQMAALAVKSVSQTRPSDTAAYVANFSGTNRYILDYLVEEILRQQPESVHAFLLQTSVLARLCGPLCDAVTGRKAEPGRPTGRVILEELERANLFLMPLDAERRWYRYHQLFADLLRARLEQEYPDLVVQLYVRASQWYESQDMVVDAVAQALAAPDKTYAADLLERAILRIFYYGEIIRVHQWLDALPKALLRQRPLLCAVYAAAIALLPPYPPLSLPAAEEWMSAAEACLPGNAVQGELARAYIASIRAYWARFRGDAPDQVIDRTRHALSLLPSDPDAATDGRYLRLRSAAETNLALTYWEAGDEDAARLAFIKARAVSQAGDDLFNASQSVIMLAGISCRHGQLNEAAAACREALDYFDRRQAQLGHPVAYSGEIGVQLAEILIEQNQLGDAERLLKENMELAKWTAGANILTRGHLALARLAAARSNSAAALEHLDAAGTISSQVEDLAGADRARLWLAMSAEQPKYLALAQQWGRKLPLTEFQEGSPSGPWAISLALVCLWLAEADSSPSGRSAAPRPGELLEWLGRQERAVQSRGWAHWEIRLGVLEGLVRRKMGDQAGAITALRHALELAAPGGYIRVFVEQGEPMRALLQAFLQTPPSSGNAYVQRLLDAFATGTQPPPAHGRPGDLAEPLTERETEILHWLVQGYSNRQIADQLFLAEGTVKFYVHAILGKLGVHTRGQAVVEAKKHQLA
jgi:LuxR family maltose regulon positive regulatory protein